MKEKEAEIRKTIKQHNNDERLHVINNKAYSISFGVTLKLLLIFGAFISVFPPENFNIIPIGILSIVGIAVALSIILNRLYYNDVLDIERPPNSVHSIIRGFLFCLIATVLMGIRWFTIGLSGMGIAFFAVFAVLLILLAFNLHVAKKFL